MGIIYKISGPNNIPEEIKEYVGQTTKTMLERWDKHKANYKYYLSTDIGIYLYEIFKKYNIINFTLTELEECTDDLLNEREIYWIKELDTVKPNGYNLQSGGKGAAHHPDTKAKMSQNSKNEQSKDLPAHINYYIHRDKHGYRITYHPLEENFSVMVNKSEPLTDDMLIIAKRHLQSYIDAYNRSISDKPESLPTPEVLPKFGNKTLELSQGLPRYINYYTRKNSDNVVSVHGYKIRHGPSLKCKFVQCSINQPLTEAMKVEAIKLLEGLVELHEQTVLANLVDLQI